MRAFILISCVCSACLLHRVYVYRIRNRFHLKQFTLFNGTLGPPRPNSNPTVADEDDVGFGMNYNIIIVFVNGIHFAEEVFL